MTSIKFHGGFSDETKPLDPPDSKTFNAGWWPQVECVYG